MNCKNIPAEDWSKYPEIKPKESGYYLTTYLDLNLYYKCIYWCNKRQDWISWRSPFSSTPHNFEVGCFVEKTRTDFYHPEKVEELYLDMRTLEKLAQGHSQNPPDAL